MISALGRRNDSLVARLWHFRWCYLFVLPGLALTALFTLWPIIASGYYSLFDWDGISRQMYFIGAGNYREIIHDSFFWGAFGRSFLFMVVTVPLEVGLGLLIALVLNEQSLRLAPAFRTLFFLPVVMTTAIMSIVMQFVFAAYQGPVNEALIALHIVKTPVAWLAQPTTVMPVAMLIFVWKWMGQPMIYWLAALQTVPPECLEAARVDGARAWQIFRRITVPLVAPFGGVIVFIIAVGNLNVFAFLEALTGGGPFFASETMELYIYRMAFGASIGSVGTTTRLGYASAAAIFFGLSVMLVAAPQIGLVSFFRRRQINVGRQPL
ncbi:MAG: sugar ABC transporter permease [Candidatus Dormibacteraeota bacterium]|nr:sugar ABC transporter permease [Candidatus Dormibacteraeota bacterium]